MSVGVDIGTQGEKQEKICMEEDQGLEEKGVQEENKKRWDGRKGGMSEAEAQKKSTGSTPEEASQHHSNVHDLDTVSKDFTSTRHRHVPSQFGRRNKLKVQQ